MQKNLLKGMKKEEKKKLSYEDISEMSGKTKEEIEKIEKSIKE